MKKVRSIFNISAISLVSLAIFSFSQFCVAEAEDAPVINSENLELITLMGKGGTKDVHNHISLFFIQKANAIKIMPDMNKKEPNCYSVVLSGVSNKVIYFSDAPKRVTGTISISKFLLSWQHGFPSSQSGPNGVIHGDINHKDVGDIVLLSNPAYDSKHQQMSYSACSIQHNKKIFADGQIIDNALIFIDPINPFPP